MRRSIVSLLTVSIFSLVIAGCSTKVNRMDEKDIKDLSGRWNDTDSRLVSEEMVKDCLSRPWIGDFAKKSTKKPVVIVGAIFNRTSEHIATGTFTKDLERSMINSRAIKVVASAVERGDVRDERTGNQPHVTAATRKKLRQETGADFILTGVMETIVDQSGKKKVVFYQVDLQLIDLQTNEKVWIGDKKLKKFVTN